MPVSLPVLTPEAMRGIHHRLAVGDGGAVWYYDDPSWSAQAKLEAEVGGINRRSVWGTTTNGVETFYLAGTQGSTAEPGILACSLGGGGPSLWTPHTGFSDGAQLGVVFGSLGLGGGQGPLWAFTATGNDDIYYSSGLSTTWTTTSPEGCADGGTGGTTPCSQTAGDLRDLYASGPTDAWLVGTSGILLQWDGVKWNHLTAAFPSQTAYMLTAVYSSPSEKLVTIAAYTSWSAGRNVVLFNYNSDLQRWFGPVTLVASAQNPNDEIRDIGGQGYSVGTGLYMVGARQVGRASCRERVLCVV